MFTAAFVLVLAACGGGEAVSNPPTFVIAEPLTGIPCNANGSQIVFLNEDNCDDAIDRWSNLVPPEVAEPGSAEALETILDLCSKARSPNPGGATVRPELTDLYTRVRTELCFVAE